MLGSVWRHRPPLMVQPDRAAPRFTPFTFALAVALAGCGGSSPQPTAAKAAAPRKAAATAPAADLTAARELDQQGVRAFADGRYRDAVRYFEEAAARGGPAFEIWNLARCRQKLDEPEEAAKLLERYLDRSDLAEGDRAQARSELQEIQRRPSRVTVLSAPAGAAVYLDERRGTLGRTPVTLDVPNGDHAVTLELPGYERERLSFHAKYGRAVIVSATLAKGR